MIEHDGDKIRIRDAVAEHWKDFAVYLHLDKGNNLNAEFDCCSHDSFKMADRVIELYLNNERDLTPPVNPSWTEVLEALRKMKLMELVRKLETYFNSSSDQTGLLLMLVLMGNNNMYFALERFDLNFKDGMSTTTKLMVA